MAVNMFLLGEKGDLASVFHENCQGLFVREKLSK